MQEVNQSDTQETRIQQALVCLRQGLPIIVSDDEGRENEGDLIASAATVRYETLNLMAKEARGLFCAPLSAEIAQRLSLPQMVERNTDHHTTAFTVSVDERDSTTTGISIQDRLTTFRMLANPHAKPENFRRPGHIFPLVARKRGLFERQGHTEAAVTLMKLASLPEAAVICEILNEDGTMARRPQLLTFAERHQLPYLTVRELIEYLKNQPDFVRKETQVEIPTDYGLFTMVSFTNQADRLEHFALVCGDPAHAAVPPLCRLHSECLTGDLLASRRCDCGSQLHAALRAIQNEGCGILLYLRQEGRGIGLFNKLKAYQLQDEGLDTVDANLKLGYDVDNRDYGIAAGMLRELGVASVRLMTNNPIKVSGLSAYHIHIAQRIPLETVPNETNRFYLETKKKRMGHWLTAL